MNVAIVHDYLTQRGGAERVVLALRRAFPAATVYTSLYDPERTFDEFRTVSVEASALNHFPFFRGHHRAASPLFPAVFSRMAVDADVAICSSSGWAHAARVSGRKIVYCHTPARWIYSSGRPFGTAVPMRVAADAARGILARWDRRAAMSADLYIANSRWTAHAIGEAYGRDAVVVLPPPGLAAAGDARAVEEVAEGFVLCVSRLLPYKNVEAIVSAFDHLPALNLVVVGDGPTGATLRARAGRNVAFLPRVEDIELRWLYTHCLGLVAASYEDFGLTPVEAASLGRPAAVLRFGGYLETVTEGLTGVFFDTPDPRAIAEAVAEMVARNWYSAAIRTHASRFGEAAFIARMQELIRDTGAAE